MSESPSGYFPLIAGVQWDYTGPEETDSTDILTSFNGREQRRANFPLGGYRRWGFTTTTLTQTDRKLLIDFFRTKRGRYAAFYFWRLDADAFTSYPAGTVSGSSTFIVPFKSTTLGMYSNVTVAGVSKALSTVTNGVGAGGEDQITFTAGAQTGAVVFDLSYGAFERVVCRFDQDALANTWGANLVPNLSLFRVTLKEVI